MSSQRGFVLLYTLWVLLGGVILFGGVSLWSQQRAQATAAQLRSQQLETRLESAAHGLSFRLLSLASTPLGLAQTQLSSFEANGIRAELQATHGLLDLNHADPGDMVLVLRAAGIPDAALKAEALMRRRPVQTYASLAAIGLDERSTRCLLRHVTLSSGQSRPRAELAPTDLRRLLGLKLGASGFAADDLAAASPVAGQVQVAGSGFRYWLRHAGDPQGSELVVEVRVTGRGEPPIQVLEWYWLPRVAEQARGCRP